MRLLTATELKMRDEASKADWTYLCGCWEHFDTFLALEQHKHQRHGAYLLVAFTMDEGWVRKSREAVKVLRAELPEE